MRAEDLRDFLHECVASTPTDQAARLVEAAHLLAPLCDMHGFEAMIACGAYESAALLVLGEGRPFLISRGANGVCLASTVFAEDEEATAQGATPALALLAAHVAAVLADAGRTGVPLWRSPSAAAARLN
jgi:hypothetical protein